MTEQIIGNSVLDKYFDETTMSLHLKVNRPILRKKWTPWNWNPVVDPNEIMTKEMFDDLIDQLFKEVETREDAFLEINRELSKVLQIGPYRIVIVYPALSDGLELTAVKPVKKMTIEEYNLDSELFDLLRNKSKGILVSWAPGSGKSTFTAALIELYHKDNHIIKTIESPRDLMLDDDIVQYSFTYWSHDEVRDILLLSRPDFTIYDEVRNKPDFELYKDLRLTGIWLVGVIHATKPVDSIQRFIGSIEMGIIPQVIDTVIFIDKGQITEVLQLELTAKVPDGMLSEELARPVIVVSSFIQKKPLYEIYTFGEQVVVMPIAYDESWAPKTVTKQQVVSWYAKEGIQRKLQQLLPCDFHLSIKWNEIDLYIPEYFKGKIIWKGGTAISNLEKEIWLAIHVKTFNELPLLDVKVDIAWGDRKNEPLIISLPENYRNKTVPLLVDDGLVYAKTDNNANIVINSKQTASLIKRKGFVVVNTEE